MSIAILPFAVWPEGINQASIPANDNAWRAEILNGNVISQVIAAQPGSPAEGAIYIIPAAATGVQWALFTAKDLAIFKGGSWHAFAPVEGVVVNVAGSLYKYEGGVWTAVGTGGGTAWADLTGMPATVDNIGDLVDPAADRLLFWDDSAGALVYLTLGTNLSITGTTLDAAGGGADAEDVAYDNAGSGLTATDVQAAIDELAGGAGTLTNWTEAVSTAAPNATVPVVSFTATNAATNVDAALVAKGTGAIAAQVADSTSAGGNKRGIYSVDWQHSRTAAANVASQQYSVIGGGTDNKTTGSTATIAGGNANVASNTYAAIGGGSTNTASGDSSAIPGGAGCTASGQYSFSAGSSNNVSGTSAGSLGASNIVSGNHSFGFGQSNTVNAQYSFVHGNQGSARALVGARVHSVSSHNQAGDLQSLGMVLRCSTSNATPAVMTTTNAAASTTNQMVLQNNQSATVAGKVVARDSSGSTASWTFAASIKRGANAAATAMVAACTPVQVAADAGASTWALTVTADTTNGALAVTFTGAAATNIRAGCVIEDIECTF